VVDFVAPDEKLVNIEILATVPFPCGGDMTVSRSFSKYYKNDELLSVQRRDWALRLATLGPARRLTARPWPPAHRARASGDWPS
jgi:hypothetical protein